MVGWPGLDALEKKTPWRKSNKVSKVLIAIVPINMLPLGRKVGVCFSVFSSGRRLLNQLIDFCEKWCKSRRMRSPYLCVFLSFWTVEPADRFLRNLGWKSERAIIMISGFSTRCKLLNQWIDFHKTEYENFAVGGQPSPLGFQIMAPENRRRV